MRLKTLSILSMVMVFAVVGFAQISPEYADWADQPQGFLLTKDEKQAWKDVGNDKEARDFIALFWARRNPKPEAAFNEFKARFEGMVKYCDENFSYEGKRGAMSDPGKVFLLMGPPHNAAMRGPTQTVSGTGGAGVTGQTDRGSDQVSAEAKLWSYDPARMNKRFKAKGSHLLFTFYEEKPLTNEFILDRSSREATMSFRAMSRAPEVYLLHPDMETVPKPVSVPGGSPATETQLTAVEGTLDGALQQRVYVMSDLGVADAAHRPLWLHFSLPEDAPKIEQFAGQVMDGNGEEVLSTFQIKAQSYESGNENIYHLTLPLAEGAYNYQVAGLIADQVQFVQKEKIEIPAAPETTWYSVLFAGLNAEQKPDVMLGEAYTFGAWHLMPLVSDVVPKESQLSYFGYVVNPVIEEGVEPKAKLKLTLRKDGKRLGKPLSMNLPMAQVSDGVYMYANALNLAAFPAGPCALEFKISVGGTEESVKTIFNLDIVE